MARKSRIAAVYMQVLPSMDGFFDEITRETEKGMPDAGGKAGRKWGNAFKTAFKALGIATAITGTLATAVSAGVLKGGISRALNIEDAQATLKGLGYAAKDIKSVTDDVLRSVLGTAYALDEGMKIAATALAAGVPKGRGLEAYLKLIADTATITNSELGEIGYIFNNVEASQRAYTGELNMLAERGLPIFSWLQKAYGVTAYELRKMVKDGEVDANTFKNVIQENIGGAALASADTTRGAFANVQAALARLGASAVQGGLPVLQEALLRLIPFVDDLTKRLKPLAEQFWETFGPKLINALDKTLSYITGLITGNAQLPGWMLYIIELGTNVAITFLKWADVLRPYMGIIIDIVRNLLSVALPLLLNLSYWLKDNATLVGNLVLAFFAIKGGIAGVGIAIKTFQTLGKAIAFAKDSVNAINLILFAHKVALDKVGIALKNNASLWWANASSKIKYIAVEVWLAIKRVVFYLWLEIKALVVATASWVKRTAVLIATKTATLAVAAATRIAAAAQWALNAAMNANPFTLLIVAITAVVAGLVWFFSQTEVGKQIWAGFVGFLTDTFSNIGSFFTDVWNNIIKGMADFGGWIVGIANNIGNFFISIGKGIANFFIGAVNFVINFVNGLINMISVVLTAIPNAFGANLSGLSTIANVPMLATGANLMGPSLFIGGEKKPETVTDLGQTNKHIANSNALAEMALKNGNSQKPVIIENVNFNKLDNQSTAELWERFMVFAEGEKMDAGNGGRYGT